MFLSRVQTCLRWLRAVKESFTVWRPRGYFLVRPRLETLEARAAAAVVAPLLDAAPATTAIVRVQDPIGGLILAPVRPPAALSSWQNDRLFGDEDPATLRTGNDLALFGRAVDWSAWSGRGLENHLETLGSGKDETWIFFAAPTTEVRAAVSDRVFAEPAL